MNHPIDFYWTLKPYPTTPIKVRENMVTQAFKKEPPYANYILISGKYQYPTDDNICQGENLESWLETGGLGTGDRAIRVISGDIAVGTQCLEFQGKYDPIAAVTNFYAYPLPADLDL